MKLKKFINTLCVVVMVIYTTSPLVLANNEKIQTSQQDVNQKEESIEDTEQKIEDDSEKENEENEEEKEVVEEIVSDKIIEEQAEKNTKIEQQEQKKQELQQEYLVMSVLSSSREIEDGVYQIVSAVDQSKVLDIDGASTKNGANVHIWNNNKTDQQKFKITYMEDGYYTIEAKHSGKLIEVAGGSTKNGANVQQYQSNNTDGQKWIIKKTEDGYYNIISKKSEMYLDVNEGSNKPGTNVQQYEKSGSKAQKFLLKECVPLRSEKNVEDGVYQIVSAVDQSKVLDIDGASKKNGANVHIWNNNKTDQQKFKITYMEDGYYTIEAKHSGKLIEVAGGSTKNGANVQQYQSNNTDGQKWIIKETEDGYYNIISKKSEMYLDVNEGSNKPGTNVQQYEKSGSKAQKFLLKECAPLKSEKTVENGVYQIVSAVDANQVLDIAGASTKNGANVNIWNNNNVNHQKIKITYMEDGYYTLEAIHSGKLIEVAGGATHNGANVQQYESNNTDGQKWIIKETEDGYYNIISKKSELYLDVDGGSNKPGTNVQQYERSGTKAQKFRFVESEAVLTNGTYKIMTAMEGNKVLDIADGSLGNGANAIIWHNINVHNQEFIITYIGAGYYTITASHSGKVLEVEGDSTKNEANVYQYENNNTDTQKWIIKETEDGYYNIISKYNSLYLEAEGGSTNDGTNVQVAEQNGTVAQKFQIKETYFGIDVSKHQGEINFAQLAKSNKVDFMIARAGYGRESYQKDQQFERNYQQAKAYGIPIGTYLYSYATDVEGAKKEAYNMLEWIKGKDFELPVFYDIEDPSQEHLDKQTQTQMCLAFCEIIKNAGYDVGIYTGKYWLEYYIDTTKIPDGYTMWIASYGTNNGQIPNDGYKYTGRHEIWQYTSTGSIPGIKGDVDMNISHKKLF